MASSGVNQILASVQGITASGVKVVLAAARQHCYSRWQCRWQVQNAASSVACALPAFAGSSSVYSRLRACTFYDFATWRRASLTCQCSAEHRHSDLERDGRQASISSPSRRGKEKHYKLHALFAGAPHSFSHAVARRAPVATMSTIMPGTTRVASMDAARLTRVLSSTRSTTQAPEHRFTAGEALSKSKRSTWAPRAIRLLRQHQVAGQPKLRDREVAGPRRLVKPLARLRS